MNFLSSVVSKTKSLILSSSADAASICRTLMTPLNKQEALKLQTANPYFSPTSPEDFPLPALLVLSSQQKLDSAIEYTCPEVLKGYLEKSEDLARQICELAMPVNSGEVSM
eukprot:TRINITY_DN14680_c0_g2_i2.p2 TRINITY_DN14680_c0_g2~~TRINITY_DN14680_c0_g2_i2.p2  ORF type:complete len:111 (+),score=28.57 TRINITY_DN14680_c0_g2_i2:121-453(+)